jgi:hypothetical protein
MEEYPGEIFKFRDVTVTIPPQSSGEKLRVIKKKISPDIGNSEDFSPTRLVINIALVGAEKQIVTSFDPPIKITVRYNINDLYLPAKEGVKLKLAYWNMETWVLLSTEEYNYELQPPASGGTGVVYISGWSPDPALGWGT